MVHLEGEIERSIGFNFRHLFPQLLNRKETRLEWTEKNNQSNILFSSTDLTPSYWRGTMVILLVDAELERGKGKETGCFGKRRLYERIKGEENVLANNVRGKMVV